MSRLFKLSPFTILVLADWVLVCALAASRVAHNTQSAVKTGGLQIQIFRVALVQASDDKERMPLTLALVSSIVPARFPSGLVGTGSASRKSFKFSVLMIVSPPFRDVPCLPTVLTCQHRSMVTQPVCWCPPQNSIFQRRALLIGDVSVYSNDERF